MNGIGKLLRPAAAIFLMLLMLSGCSGSKIAPYGTVDVDVTDAPDLDYEHVFITVKKIAFHSNPDADNSATGWEIQDMSSKPVTIDLAQLSNGRLYADTSADNQALFSDVVLPSGTYRQIKLFLASTEDTNLAPSAIAQGLQYNNQATFDDGTNAPIRIPNITEGIKLIPETPLKVIAGKKARLALDFNLFDDMFVASPENQIECILKPRLGYFDLGAVGAIKGKVSFSDLHTPYFTILAEQVLPGKSNRVVRRITTIDTKSGEFNLYPLPVPDDNNTAVYDILLRGANVQTTIVKNVKVHKGTNLRAGAVDLGTITMNPGNEFTAQLGATMHPSGAWLKFYQTLTTDPIPFEVRSRHLNPYTGKFTDPIELSSETIQVYDFSSGSLSGPTIDATTTPGSFAAVTEAVLYSSSAGVNVSGTVGSMTLFTPNPLTASPSANKIDAVVSIPASLTGILNQGYIFITSGGLIIDCFEADSLIAGGGGSYTIQNLPGGTAANQLSGAYYDVNVLGLGSGKIISGSQFSIDLTSGNGTAAITLQK